MKKLFLIGLAISLAVFIITFVATGSGVELDMMAYLKRFNNAPNLMDLISDIKNEINNVSTAFEMVEFGNIDSLNAFFTQIGLFFIAIGQFFKALFVILVILPIKLIWYVLQILWCFIPVDSLKGV